MASSSSNQYVTEEVGEKGFPYPSNLSAASFISVKLSGKDIYLMWKTQMLCLLKSHDMFGFINGSLTRPQPSVSGKEVASDLDTRLLLWTRSDALVKGWILGSLSEQTLGYVLNRLTELQPPADAVLRDTDFSARDLWDMLQTIYRPDSPTPLEVIDGPAVLQQVIQEDSIDTQQQAKRATHRYRLYEATLAGKFLPSHDDAWKSVKLTDTITNNGDTALHLAVRSSRNLELLEHLLEMIPVIGPDKQLSDVKNSDGSTPLHVAAVIGNSQAAEMLLQRDPSLFFITDGDNQTPLALALSNMHTETVDCLLRLMNQADEKTDDMFSNRKGHVLLAIVISSKNFGLAHQLLMNYRKLDGEAVMMAIAQNFPIELNMLDKFLVRYTMPRSVKDVLKTTFKDNCEKSYNLLVDSKGSCLLKCGTLPIEISNLIFSVIFGITKVSMLILGMMLTWMYVALSSYCKERLQSHSEANQLLETVCCLIKANKECSSYDQYYMNAIFEATRQNAYEVVQKIVDHFPNAILSTNEDSHNIIQYAVITRSEKVYNLLYQMSEHKNIYRTVKDSHENNLLHLAARLAPTNKLNRISGAALQLQHELKWFKEVERFVCPLNIIQKNMFGETPQMLFTREHKDLVLEGEKWMKATAESCTITAALITTIVFAAAITVPGGSYQDTGIPVFSNTLAFRIFALSDAISMFAAVTSLLVFLSILTARFAEQDFLFKLPTKLIIGLATLFISTAAMLVAFGATLYLVCGQSNSDTIGKLRSKSWILAPIALLTYLPITSFASLQLHLIHDLIGATHGRSMFGKNNDARFY